MSSIEQEVKQQFARVFTRQDWSLFKRMADYYLRSAVFLRTWDVKPPKDLKLLARNCQKRLFIGIGTELLLKAIYRGSDEEVAKRRERLRAVMAMVEPVRESRVGAGGERDVRARDRRRPVPPPSDAALARSALERAAA